jgi:transcriptional regulator of nitric oxide reductase
MEADAAMWRAVNKREKVSIIVLGLCIVALTAIFFLRVF